MTGERVKEVCDLYINKVAGFGPPTQMADLGLPLDKAEALRHVAWMAQQTKVFVDEGRIEKAMRWLGFMQGWLVAYAVYPISDTMIHNAPPGTKFDQTA
jgi:hypothetical protein